MEDKSNKILGTFVCLPLSECKLNNFVGRYYSERNQKQEDFS